MKTEYVIENGIKYTVKNTFEYQRWFLDGKFHRELGPAITYLDGTQVWYWDGKRHRTDGPALIYADGAQVWYYHGLWIQVSSQEEFEQSIKLRAFQ